MLKPHAPLARYYRGGDDAAQRAFLRRIFDATAVDYDRIERVLAFGTGRWYRRDALRRAGLGSGAAVLDVGIGTGLVAREALALVGPAGRLVGVDPSPGMMDRVRDRVPPADAARIELRAGRAEALPCDDRAFDFVSVGYALRHLGDVAAAFAEFHRVLRPGGRVAVLEITRADGRLGNLLLKAYMRGVVPWIARLVATQRETAELWRYYWDTIEACISPDAVLSAFAAAGFVDVRRSKSLGILSEYTATKPSGPSTTP